MAITIEGINITTSIEALSQGEGFIVRLNTNWNTDRETRRLAEQEGLLGEKLNAHEATFGEAQTRLSTAIGAFVTGIQAFITTNSV